MPPLSNLAVRDIETLVHPYTNLATLRETGPLIIERGEGVFVYDTEGKSYIEGMAGLWCTALGYGNEELVEAAAAQMRKLSFAHLFTAKSHDPAIELAERLKEIAPVPTSKVFFCSSGSEANDSQVKLVWYLNNALGRPRKKKIISRRKAYHGVTVMAASLTGLANNHLDFDLPIAGILHTSCPHHYRFAHAGETEREFARRVAGELDELIRSEDPDTVAAFIAEPVMGAGGVIVPPEGYFQEIMKVCRAYDVYMISDEVICGFGRLGTMFGCTALGFEPHSITLAKALTSAYVPLAAVALKALDIYARERIAEQAARKAPQFQGRLAALGEHPLVGEARGIGLVGGVELVADKKTKRSFEPKAGVGARAVRYAEEEGLIVRSLLGDILSICPPLIIAPAEIDELFDRLERALDRTLAWVEHERLIAG
jgi:4-aminobutyrate--pyruvate transaminase